MSNKADAVAITDEGTSFAELGHSRLYVWNTGTLVWERMTQPGGSGGGAATIANGADVAQGNTADAAWVSGSGTVISLLKKIASAGGSAVSVADGADVAQGTTTDLSSANTIVGILKAIKAAVTGTLTTSGTGTGFQDGSQLAGGTAVTVATQATTMAGVRNAAGNSSVMTGLSDNADAVAVNAGGNLLRTVSELFGFNGTSWDRLRSTTANGLAVDVTRVTGTVNVNPTGETAGVGVGAAADTSASNSVIGRLKALIALLPTALGAGGGLKVDGSGTALPVSGTVTANLPTGGGKTLLFAAVSVAASGANSIVAADATRKIKVVSYVLVADAAVTAKWQNAATDISGAMSFAANGGASAIGSVDSHLMETSVNQALNLNLGGAIGVRGHISYFLE